MENKEIKLEKCPLCGGNATIHFSVYANASRVACDKCRCNTGGYTKKEEAVKAWNTRV